MKRDIIIGLIFSVVVIGTVAVKTNTISLDRMFSRVTEIEVPLLPQKDAVTTHFENKLRDYDTQKEEERKDYVRLLGMEEKAIRSTLIVENKYMEEQAVLYSYRAVYASTTDDLANHFDLNEKLGISIDYNTLSKQMGIKTMK